jgi:nitroreductase
MDIVESINVRKSIRAFKPDPVPKIILEKVMETALRAPSWGNTQPWDFFIAANINSRKLNADLMKKQDRNQSPISPVPRVSGTLRQPPAF